MKPKIIISTYPNYASVKKISMDLVKNNIVACVNTTKISSIYRWKGKIETTDEYLAVFKTQAKNLKKLKDRITETHPYEVPEIMEIEVTSINQSYFKWLLSVTI